jgi:hypothetical protein
MKVLPSASLTIISALASSSLVPMSAAFVAPSSFSSSSVSHVVGGVSPPATTILRASPEVEDREVATTTTTTTTTTTAAPAVTTTTTSAPDVDVVVEGLPWWWEYIWELPMMKLGAPGTDCTFADGANVLRTNIEQIYGGYPSLDRCPLATGALDDIADGTMFIGLQRYAHEFGSPYKLCFGPKSFLVISDPVQAKHVLRDANTCYDKGILAEILKPIMGKGLIPADPETWTVRRRAIVPAFHKAWLNHMVGLFGHCNTGLISSLELACDKADAPPGQIGGKIEMEEKFCSVALDIIGLSVFNYDFGSVTNESPVIKAVYSALVEAEHRSMTPAPYWDIPFANELVPRLRKFNSDLELLDSVLTNLIDSAKNSRTEDDIEELERRDYDNVKDPSLLRFLVDMRGADIDNKQLVSLCTSNFDMGMRCSSISYAAAVLLYSRSRPFSSFSSVIFLLVLLLLFVFLLLFLYFLARRPDDNVDRRTRDDGGGPDVGAVRAHEESR